MRKRDAIVLIVTLVLSVGVFVGPASGGSQQTHVSELVPSDGEADDRAGWSVFTDGTVAITGAPYEDDGGNSAGAAYLYSYSGTRWVDGAKLTAWDAQSEPVANDRFGDSVAISGEWAMVGAPNSDPSGLSGAGAVYVFRNQNGVWRQWQKLVPADLDAKDGFGGRMDLDGTTLVVTAPTQNEADLGAAYVYVLNGSSWQQQQRLTASDGYAGDYFGLGVAVDGDTLAVGHPHENSARGDVHVYTRSSGVWTERTTLAHSDPANNDNFGWSVGIDGGTIAVGVPQRSSSMGEVFVFNGSGASWSSDAVLLAPGRAASDRFGEDVDVVGGTIAVGTPGYDGPYTDSGAVWAFGGSGSSWTPYPAFHGQDKVRWGLEYENATRNGSSVSMSGTTLISGAPLDGTDPATTRTGSAHVFDLPAGSDPRVYTDNGVAVTFNAVTTPGFDADYSDPESLRGLKATERFQSVNSTPTGFVMTDRTLFDVTNNVLFSGTFTITLPYDDDNVPNWLNEDGPVAEADLRILHWDGEDWADITSSVDTATNTVTGVASLFSEFVIAESGTATDSPYFGWDPGGANLGTLGTPHKDYRTTTQKCQVCHAVHDAKPDGEMLLPTTVANACVYCHITTSIGGIIVYGGDPANYLSEDDFGHQYAGGAGVACADCHSVHGSNTIGGDQGLETKILRAGGYQSEFVSHISTGGASDITDGWLPGNQDWGVGGWDENDVQLTAFCTRCHQNFAYTSTQTVAATGFRTHPMRLEYDPDDTWPPIAPDIIGKGIEVSTHSTRGCSFGCHDVSSTSGVGVNVRSFPHHVPGADKMLDAQRTMTSHGHTDAVESESDDVCLVCHWVSWESGEVSQGVGVDY